MFYLKIVAAIVTISGSGIWIFANRKDIKAKAKIYAYTVLGLGDDDHCPNFRINKKRFSWNYAKIGIGLIFGYVKKCDPTVIFGINRGGAIIGGLVAKHLDFPRVNLLDVRPEKGEVIEQRKDIEIDTSHILLLDDSIRRGVHMEEASNYLRREYDYDEITRITLLNVTQANPAPGKDHIQQIAYSPFSTSRGDALLPWDEWDE